MYPIIFEFGNFHIYSHGVMIIFGIFFGSWLLFYLLRFEKIEIISFLKLIFYSFLGGILGARILYLFLYSDQFSNWLEMLKVWNGGIVSFGAMIGGLVVAALYLKKINKNVLKWFDLATPGLLLGWAIGRIGCFLNGDSFGIPTLSKWGIWGHFPTPLYESIWLLIISMICLIIIKMKISNLAKIKWLDGLVFGLGFGLYGLGRFWIDFFKDEPIWFWNLKYGQIGSLFVLAIALTLIIAIIIYGKRNPSTKLGVEEKKC